MAENTTKPPSPPTDIQGGYNGPVASQGDDIKSLNDPAPKTTPPPASPAPPPSSAKK